MQMVAEAAANGVRIHGALHDLGIVLTGQDVPLHLLQGEDTPFFQWLCSRRDNKTSQFIKLGRIMLQSTDFDFLVVRATNLRFFARSSVHTIPFRSLEVYLFTACIVIARSLDIGRGRLPMCAFYMSIFVFATS